MDSACCAPPTARVCIRWLLSPSLSASTIYIVCCQDKSIKAHGGVKRGGAYANVSVLNPEQEAAKSAAKALLNLQSRSSNKKGKLPPEKELALRGLVGAAVGIDATQVPVCATASVHSSCYVLCALGWFFCVHAALSLAVSTPLTIDVSHAAPLTLHLSLCTSHSAPLTLSHRLRLMICSGSPTEKVNYRVNKQ